MVEPPKISNLIIEAPPLLKSHSWEHKRNEPTEKESVCKNCGVTKISSKVGGKHTTTFITKEGETFHTHFGDKAPTCGEPKVVEGVVKKSQLGMFGEEPQSPPKVENAQVSATPKGNLTSNWHISGDRSGTEQFHKELKSYPTHTAFLQSDHPYVNKIKELHNNDTDKIRENFNNITGRWNSKPTGANENALRMKFEHEGVPYITKEHWKVPDLPDEHKKEIDNFASPKDFHAAVSKGEVSQGLLDYLKNYSFYSHHIDKAKNEDDTPFYTRQFYEKEGKVNWGDPNSTKEHHLQKWFKYPVSSNMKDFESGENEKDDYAQDIKDQLKYMQNKNKLSEHFPEGSAQHLVGSDLTQALADRGYYEDNQNLKQYQPNDKFTHAGTEWSVVRNGEVMVDAVNRYGDRKQILKTDIENMPEIDLSKKDIHNPAFKKKLQDISKEQFSKMGYSDEEAESIRNHAFNYENAKAPEEVAGDYEDLVNKKKWALLQHTGEIPSLDKESIKKHGFGNAKVGDRLTLEDIYKNMGFPADHESKEHVKSRIRRHLLEMEHNANPEGHHDPLITRSVGRAHKNEADESEKGIMYKLAKTITQNLPYIGAKNPNFMLKLVRLNENTKFEKSLNGLTPLEVMSEQIRLEDTIIRIMNNFQQVVLSKGLSKSILDNNAEALKKATDKHGKVFTRLNSIFSMNDGLEKFQEAVKMMKSFQNSIEEFEITESGDVKFIYPNSNE